MIDLLRFWFQNKPSFAPWDIALNAALDKYGVSIVNAHDAQVGPFNVWVSNYPYAFGYNREDPLEHIPSCATRMKLRRAIMAFQTARYMEQL